MQPLQQFPSELQKNDRHIWLKILIVKTYVRIFQPKQDKVAEWLRRWTANPLGSARVSSNLILVEFLYIQEKRQQ
jgi:hypothetical protein